MEKTWQELATKITDAVARQAEAQKGLAAQKVGGESEGGQVKITVQEGRVAVVLSDDVLRVGRLGLQQAVAQAVQGLLAGNYIRLGLDETELADATAEFDAKNGAFQDSLMMGIHALQERMEATMPTFRESPGRRPEQV